MSSEQSAGDRSYKSQREPYRVRLPGFINDEEIGLGEVLKRTTSVAGIKPCGACAERARMLNNWMVFSKRR